jgi:hypothetical protein
MMIYLLQLCIANALQEESSKLGLSMFAFILQTVNIGILVYVESSLIASLIPVVSQIILLGAYVLADEKDGATTRMMSEIILLVFGCDHVAQSFVCVVMLVVSEAYVFGVLPSA